MHSGSTKRKKKEKKKKKKEEEEEKKNCGVLLTCRLRRGTPEK